MRRRRRRRRWDGDSSRLGAVEDDRRQRNVVLPPVPRVQLVPARRTIIPVTPVRFQHFSTHPNTFEHESNRSLEQISPLPSRSAHVGEQVGPLEVLHGQVQRLRVLERAEEARDEGGADPGVRAGEEGNGRTGFRSAFRGPGAQPCAGVYVVGQRERALSLACRAPPLPTGRGAPRPARGASPCA